MMLRDGGTYEGRQILDPQVPALMEEPQAVSDEFGGYYGRATMIDTVRQAPGLTLFEHKGWIKNFYSRAGYTKYPRSAFAWSMNTFFEEQADTFIIANLVNAIKWMSDAPPVIVSLPPVAAHEDSGYVYQIEAIDADSTRFRDCLSYHLESAPSWLAIDTSTGRLTGAPSKNDVGNDSISIQVSDNFGGNTIQSFVLHVNHTNHPPQFRSIPGLSALEDSSYSYHAYAADADSAIFGDRVLYRFNSPSSWLSIDSVTGLISGTPRGPSLKDSLVRIEAYDGSGLVAAQQFSISILHVNHNPVITSSALTPGAEDTLYRFQVIAHDTDSLFFGDTLNYQLGLSPVWLSVDISTGVLTGTPHGMDVGLSTVLMEVSDGKGGRVNQQFDLTVRHINHPPVFTGQGISAPPPADTGFAPTDARMLLLPAIEDSLYRARIHADDPDSSLFGDRVHYRITGPPTWFTIDSVSGALSGTPSGLRVRDSLVLVQAYDNKGGFTVEEFVVRVQHVNHKPALLSSPPTSISEDSLYRYPIVAQDADSALWGDAIRFALKAGPAWLGIDSVRGLLSGSPIGKDVGGFPITVEVTDGKGGTATQSFTINVNHTNHPPAFTSQPVRTATEDSVYFYNVSARDQDSLLFGDMIRYRMPTGPSWLNIDSLSGVLTGKPGRLNVHDTTIAIEAYDGKGGRGGQVFQLRVIHVNHPPVISSSPAAIAKEDSLYKYDLKASDDDAAQFGDLVRYRASVKPGWIRVDSVNGTVAGVPGAVDVGDTLVIIEVCDQFGGMATQQFALKVFHTNHAPRLQRIPDIVFPEDSSTTIHLDQYVSDSDNSTQSLRWRVGLIGDEASGQKARPTGVTSMKSALKPNTAPTRVAISARTSESRTDSLLISLDSVAHTVTLTSTKYFHGANIPIGFIVSDPGGLSAGTALFLTVTPVNHPPVLQKLAAGSFDEDDSLALPFKEWYARLSDPEDADSEHTWSVSGGRHIHATQSPTEVVVRADRDWFGTDSLRVVVADTGGLCDSTYWIVNTGPVNDPPRITSAPDTVAYADFLYRFKLVAKDPDDSLFTYRLSGPSWLSIDSLGRVSGRPDNPGKFRVSLTVQDSSHAADSLSFMLNVLPADLAKDLSNGIPQVFVLKQNYPNPFNPSTTIRFGLPERGRLTLDIYDILGQRVDRLVEGEISAGYHEIPWSPNVASGMYFLVMRGESLEHAGVDFRFVRKMMLLK